VVCSAWGGFKDVVRHGETGYLVDAVLTKHGVRVDWAAGAQFVIELLRDPELCARMGVRASERARERFGIEAVAGRLGAILAEDRRFNRRASGSQDRLPAYEPSDFAHRYEEHKRDCGWYAADAEVVWYPPMFGGRDYELYARLMEPYATRLATKLSPRELRSEWVPYLPSGARLDPARRLAEDLDPVWPHRRFLGPREWEVLRRVDGSRTLGEISSAVSSEVPGIDADDIAAGFWRLHVEGFVLFRSELPNP
jgi:hypothetical protein